ncbi:MAG: hypothetical protein P1P85_05095 [Patescibacteria group bacterium]|nr:hypothetical protein [Patescibacteria group bacterium]
MKNNKKINILSFGAESVGRFCVYNNGNITISDNFGDILDENNLKRFKKAVLSQIKAKKPDVILTDIHPLYNSTIFGHNLSKKLKVPHTKVQHHLAHIFSAVGDKFFYCEKYHPKYNQKTIKKSISIEIARNSSAPPCSAQNNTNYKLLNTKYLLPKKFYGIASDGTGLGLDGNIWGGEVFQLTQNIIPDKKAKGVKNDFATKKLRQNQNDNLSANLNINRIGSLEEQTMIGGDLAVKEPARMLISILSKFLSKEKVYANVKKFYTKNEFELLYNQLQQNFNCQQTSSTGRILDAVSVLLDFAKNERNSKHEATKLLEQNSTIPYKLAPKISFDKNENRHILQTTPLFEFLVINRDKDRKRLSTTAQKYIAEGFRKIVSKNSNKKIVPTFFAGGMTSNKIMSSYLENEGIYISKKISRGDEGIAFGQIVFYLFANHN